MIYRALANMNRERKNDRRWAKMSKLSRKIVQEFETSRDFDALFKAIHADVARMKTHCSKMTLQGQYRGYLKSIGLSHDTLKPIEFSEEDMRESMRLAACRQATVQVLTIDNDIFESILLFNDLLYVLTTTGARVGEILDNVSVLNDKTETLNIPVYKRPTPGEDDYRVVRPLGCFKIFKRKYDGINRKLSNSTLKQQANNDLKRILPPGTWKASTHLCRSIYVQYNYRFRNPTNMPITSLARKLLKHLTLGSSAYYLHVKLKDDVVPLPGDQYANEIEGNYKSPIEILESLKLCPARNIKIALANRIVAMENAKVPLTYKDLMEFGYKRRTIAMMANKMNVDITP